jgi:hypothetical protein
MVDEAASDDVRRLIEFQGQIHAETNTLLFDVHLDS